MERSVLFGRVVSSDMKDVCLDGVKGRQQKDGPVSARISLRHGTPDGSDQSDSTVSRRIMSYCTVGLHVHHRGACLHILLKVLPHLKTGHTAGSHGGVKRRGHALSPPVAKYLWLLHRRVLCC